MTLRTILDRLHDPELDHAERDSRRQIAHRIHAEAAAYYLGRGCDHAGADALVGVMASSANGADRHHWWTAYVATQQRIAREEAVDE